MSTEFQVTERRATGDSFEFKFLDQSWEDIKIQASDMCKHFYTYQPPKKQLNPHQTTQTTQDWDLTNCCLTNFHQSELCWLKNLISMHGPESELVFILSLWVPHHEQLPTQLECFWRSSLPGWKAEPFYQCFSFHWSVPGFSFSAFISLFLFSLFLDQNTVMLGNILCFHGNLRDCYFLWPFLENWSNQLVYSVQWQVTTMWVMPSGVVK